ncbi:MAG: SRPBCC family protein [Acidimicrobiia bacterium]|nr:SRPBCC family protein [Acidimicrobiia bacterium]
MRKVLATVEIDAPAEKVWEVLADFGNVQVFNPNVSRSYLTGTQPGGEGATRHCDLAVAGASIEERIVAWEEGRSYTIDIYDGVRNPFAKAVGTLTVDPIDESRSVAGMTIEWKGKGGVLSGLLDRGLVAQNRKAVTRLLAGLKHHVETGNDVAARQPLDTTLVSIG